MYQLIIQGLEEQLTTAKHGLATASISLQQYESEMSGLVRDKTEVECVIADFAQSSEASETRRIEITEQLSSIDNRVGKATERLMELSSELEARVAEEREAKER